MRTYFLDLNKQLRRLNYQKQRSIDEAAIFASCRDGTVTVGEAVQKLFSHIGTKSQAALALIHVAGLVERPLTEDELVNALQDLLIAQHAAVHQHDGPHKTDSGPIPEAHIADVQIWVGRLKSLRHVEGRAGKLHSLVL